MVDKRLKKGLNCRSYNALTVFRVLEDEGLYFYEKGLCVRSVNALIKTLFLVFWRHRRWNASRMKKNDQYLLYLKTSFIIHMIDSISNWTRYTLSTNKPTITMYNEEFPSTPRTTSSTDASFRYLSHLRLLV